MTLSKGFIKAIQKKKRNHKEIVMRELNVNELIEVQGGSPAEDVGEAAGKAAAKAEKAIGEAIDNAIRSWLETARSINKALGIPH